LPATIKDIARVTGLSLATVSKYLNGKKIKSENQAVIEACIKELGYVPNKNAQMLRGRKTNIITMLLPVIGDYFWGAVCNHVEGYMQKHNYSTVINTYDSTQPDQTDLYHHLVSTQTEGILLIPDYLENTNLLQLLQKGKIPYVFLDQVLTSADADAVTSANNEGAYQATKYLIECGHRNLGVIGGLEDAYTTIERINGFKRACQEYDISPLQQNISYNNYYSASTAAQFMKELMQKTNRPTAVFVLSYQFTIAIIQILHELNLRIPEDLSIITFDDDELFIAVEPPITVVAQDLKSMGTEAARLLLKRIGGDIEDFPRKELIETRFIERDSVKKINKS
jgi:LacI family transcriptional regulator